MEEKKVWMQRYVDEGSLEKLLNVQLSQNFGFVNVQNKKTQTNEWLQSSLVAHAGGAIREKNYISFYTNSLEALKQNYSLGHRVFELDFYLTSDGKLAAVHDWTQFGNKDGIALSSEEWKQFKTFGSPETEGRYNTMTIDDVLDQMVINKDMYLVTDTKSMEIPEEEMMKQFQEIYRAAISRDSELLNRIIPQIYSRDMYDKISTIFEYPNVIYTLYASGDTEEEVLDFVTNHKNIKAITISTGDGRFNEDFFSRLHAFDKKVFTHTIHTYDELTRFKTVGVDGFYTGLLTPKDIEVYNISTK